MGEREGQVGAGDQDARLVGGGAAGEDADAAIGEGEEEVFGVSGGRARAAARARCRRREGERALRRNRRRSACVQRRRKSCGIADGARDEAEIVDLQDVGELFFGVEARGGGAMAVLDHGAGHVDAGPSALPGAIAEIEIFHVGGLVDLIDIAERAQFGGVVERAAAAAVEHVAAVFAGQGLVAAHGEIFGRGLREHGLAGLFAADAGGEADLRGGAEEVGDLLKGALQRGEEVRLEQHVVIEQADVRAAGAGDAAVDGAREGERGGGVDDFDLRDRRRRARRRCRRCCRYRRRRSASGAWARMSGKLGLEEFLAVAGGDDDGDAGRERSRDGRGAVRDAPSAAVGRRRPRTCRGVAGEQGPVGLARGADAPAQRVGRAPRDVARDRGERRRAAA